MTQLIKRLAQKEEEFQKLIIPRKDHTLLAFHVNPDLLPCMIYMLKTNPKLTIVRAMNYSRALYRQISDIKVARLLQIFEKTVGGISALTFYGKVRPSTFKLYSYWYSRFLFHVTQFNYDQGKYQCVCDIDIDLLQRYFYSECRRGLKPNTVQGVLSAIKHMLKPFRKTFAAFLFYDTYELDALFKSLYNYFGRPRKEKLQITYFVLSKILTIVDMKKLIDVRDWLVVIIAKVGGFRGGEVAPLEWIDLIIDKYLDPFTGQNTDIIILFFDKTKTVGLKDGVVVTLSIPRESVEVYNPLYLLYHYIHLLKEKGYAGEYVFPDLRTKYLLSSNPRHITTRTMSKQLKQLWKRAGGNPDEVSMHGCRGGMVEDAVARGIPESLIQKHGRWKSQVWRSYFHDQEYAHACVSSSIIDMSKKFKSDVTDEKHKQILQYLAQKH